MLPLRVVLCALAAFAISARAQDAAGAFHISGTVIDNATGMPIRQALVTLDLFPRSVAGSPTPPKRRNLAVLTDAAGQFQFDTLEAGSYSCSAAKNGFSAEGRDQGALGPSRESLVIRLTPLARIAGRVVDSDGEPIPGVSVRALHSEIREGRRYSRQDRSVTTDDQGRYRMWNFQPGDYYIVAAGRSGGTAVVVGPTPAGGLAHEGFEPAYYPAAKDRASATVISLTPGQEFVADLKIHLQPAYRVRGTLRNLVPYQPVTVELVRGAGEVSSNRVVVSGSTGRFEANDVVPGSYLLRARQTSGEKEIRGERQVHVGNANVDGLVLDLVPGVTVTGVLQGAPAVDTPAAVTLRQGRVRTMLNRVDLIAVNAETPDGEPLSATADEQGRFSLPDVLPGRYRLEVPVFGFYVASAVSGSKDLLNGDLVVEQGVAPEPIAVQLRNDVGSITGIIEAPAAGQMWVLVVRADGSNPVSNTVNGDTFKFDFVAPGDYRAFLLKDIDTLEFRNPEVLRALRNGENVHVTAGGKATVRLKGFAQ